jgi:hypothetical protein
MEDAAGVVARLCDFEALEEAADRAARAAVLETIVARATEALCIA